MPADLGAQIETLKARIKDTQALYREVCVLLFFHHGITPTANRLYQLVHRGSMTAPAQALRMFWSELRDQTRPGLEHPDLPEALRAEGGQMLARLWQRALATAGAHHQARHDEREQQLALAQTQADEARARCAQTLAQLEALRAEHALQMARKRELARELAICQGRLASMSEMLRASAQDIAQLRARLAQGPSEGSSASSLLADPPADCSGLDSPGASFRENRADAQEDKHRS